MNLIRIPEPQFLSPTEEANVYAAMDHAEVNRGFVDDLLSKPLGDRVVDLGCGPASIAIELCRRQPGIRVLGVDAEVEMLEVARFEIDMAGLLDRIELQQADATDMRPFEDQMADAVVSNSLIHHVDDPAAALATAVRLTADRGRVFIRDLARPDSEEAVEALVEIYAGKETAEAQQLLRQSLIAAYTVDEIREVAKPLGIADANIRMTSDRHWTIDWRRGD